MRAKKTWKPSPRLATLAATAAVAAAALAAPGCTKSARDGAQSSTSKLTRMDGGTSPISGPVSSLSSTVANANNVFYRIQNALTLPQPNPAAGPNAPLVNYLSSRNFRAAAAQQLSNLSPTSNPLTASGVGSVPLLAFAACSDVNPGSYSVTGTLSSAPTTNQKNAIVNAGLTIVNQCTAGLAASGTDLGSQVTSIFNNQLAGNPAGTTATQAFVAVCTAATTFCVSMTGF